jgi:hypothetical protein
MPRRIKTENRPKAVAEHVTYAAWKGRAAALLERQAAGVMRERDWRQLYIRGKAPEDAASSASRDPVLEQPPTVRADAGKAMSEELPLAKPRKSRGKPREWSTFWYLGDKPVAERVNARLILEQAGVRVEGLVSRETPDCEGMLDGKWSGVEITELLDQPVLERSIRAVRQRNKGVEPEKAEAHFVWSRDDLLTKLQERLDEKNSKLLKGPRYERYVLVVLTNEFYLDRESVGLFLNGVSFRTKLITDAFLGLSYHPDSGYTLFRLKLEPYGRRTPQDAAV